MGSRVFPDICPRSAGDHMPPPPLPPRYQKPAFCLSAVKWRVFIDATAILRCARFQLLRCVAPKTRFLRVGSATSLLRRPAWKKISRHPKLGVLESFPRRHMQIQKVMIRRTAAQDNHPVSLFPQPLCRLPAWHPSAFQTMPLTIY